MSASIERFFLPSIVCRRFGLKMFSTEFLSTRIWDQNLKKRNGFNSNVYRSLTHWYYRPVWRGLRGFQRGFPWLGCLRWLARFHTRASPDRWRGATIIICNFPARGRRNWDSEACCNLAEQAWQTSLEDKGFSSRYCTAQPKTKLGSALLSNRTEFK